MSFIKRKYGIGFVFLFAGLICNRMAAQDCRTIAAPPPLVTFIVLIDRGCTCACEDLVMPLKLSGRAKLVGETTAGTFSATNLSKFENGMLLNVTTVRHTFPDGSQFEGIGIAPDVELHPTTQDLRTGNDVVLTKALELIKAQM
jgi:carboxyl-terminal processing protease